MADYYFGINRDDPLSQLAVSSSTTGKDVEVAVTAAGVPDKQTFLVALEKILNGAAQANWPPA